MMIRRTLLRALLVTGLAVTFASGLLAEEKYRIRMLVPQAFPKSRPAYSVTETKQTQTVCEHCCVCCAVPGAKGKCSYCMRDIVTPKTVTTTVRTLAPNQKELEFQAPSSAIKELEYPPAPDKDKKGK